MRSLDTTFPVSLMQNLTFLVLVYVQPESLELIHKLFALVYFPFILSFYSSEPTNTMSF